MRRRTYGRIWDWRYRARVNSYYRPSIDHYFNDLEFPSYPTYAEELNDARRWARDEIRRLKGLSATMDIQKYKERKEIQKWRKKRYLASRQTLGEAAAKYIRFQRYKGRSEAYIDRMEDIIHHHIAERFKKVLIRELDLSAFARSLFALKGRAGLMEDTKGVIGKVLKYVETHHAPINHIREEFHKTFWQEWKGNTAVKNPELLEWSKSDFDKILSYLDQRKDKWQQTYCIRLFFEFGAPLTRLMAANWSQLTDKYWFPVRPSEFEYWFLKKEQLTSNVSEILDKVKQLGIKEFGEQDYWFPSKYGRDAKHIRSVNHVWNDVISGLDIHYIPLSQAALAYKQMFGRGKNTPSYYKEFHRYYERDSEKYRQILSARAIY
jgi:hypothetical protein